MNKQQFLKELRKTLKNIRKKEREDYIRRYDELLSDLTENGMSEKEAVRSLGSVKDIAAELMQNMSPDSRKRKDKLLLFFLLADLILFGFNVVQFFADRFISTLFLTKTQDASAVSIIGGADGPTSVFIAAKIPGPSNFWLIAMVCMMVITLAYVIIRGRKKRH